MRRPNWQFFLDKDQPSDELILISESREQIVAVMEEECMQ